MSSEKRVFQRIQINLQGSLTIDGVAVPITVLDLSLKGMRIALPAKVLSRINSPINLLMQANEDSPQISVVVALAHYTEASETMHEIESNVTAGFTLIHIDVESMTNLRRLLLLNSGAKEVEASELNALLDSIYRSLGE